MIGQVARVAEELGFAAIEMGEHIVVPGNYLGHAGMVWYDNFVLISHLATLTKRLRFHFNALVAPYHPPVQAAKMIATLDAIAEGRIAVTIGAGHVESEFEALGVPYKTRAAMTDDYIKAMKALWTQERPTYHGRFVSFADINFDPKCVQRPHVPLMIGGTGPKARRRVAELGDGWVPNEGSLEEVSAGVQEIKALTRAAGRDAESLRFAYRLPIGEPDPWTQKPHSPGHGPLRLPTEQPKTPDEIVVALKRYHQAGFDHMRIMYYSRNAQESMGKMEWFAKEVMPAFHI